MTDMTTIETANDSPSRFAINKSPVVVNLDLVPETMVNLVDDDSEYRDMLRFQIAVFFEDRLVKEFNDQNIDAEVSIHYWPNRNLEDATNQIEGPIGLVSHADYIVLEIEKQVRRQFADCKTNEAWVRLYCEQVFGHVIPALLDEVRNR